MNHDDRLSEQEVDALLERGRDIRPVSDVVRARVLARARTTASATPAGLATATPTGHHRWRRIAFAAALFLIVASATAIAAFRAGVKKETPPAPAVEPRAAEHPARAVRPVPAPVAPATVVEKPTRGKPSPTPRESYAAELALLQRAQIAFASRDFTNALTLVAEHARHFPDGRLAEEREALRVRSLQESGHADEASRAAHAFAKRFPRSILLPRGP